MKYPFNIINITILLFLISCSGNKTAKEEEHGHHDEHESTNTVSLTSEQMKSIRIEFGTVEKKQLTASLKANGILKVPNQNKASATAMSGGVVKSILVQAGSTVTKGQIVATIANSSFVALQEEYLGISAKMTLAELEYDRQKELIKGNAGALKNLQSAEAELNATRSRKAGLSKQLELIGINPQTLTNENIQSSIRIVSPISGAVSAVLVNIGSFVDANNPIAEIVDNSQLHLDLYVYERDLPKLRVGQTIHFTLTNNPGVEYDADVFAISNTFEPSTKAIAVHATVKGNKQGLIDGMSITALVSLENATVDAVPTGAIVNHEGQDYIFVVSDKIEEDEHHETGEAHDHKSEANEKTGETVFMRIPVRKGTTDVGYSEITFLTEIAADSKLVVNGAFFLLAKMTNQGEAHEH